MSDKAERKLKSCLCGAQVRICGSDSISFWIECDACGIESDSQTTEERLIEVWNTRPTEDKLVEALKETTRALTQERDIIYQSVTDFKR